jgi:Domain of unknown function (DUF4111)/Nucleotidyltransferase domain
VVDDAEVVRVFVRVLADALARVAGDALVGVYLHGSAVLGDWSPGASDVDVLVVVRSGVTSIVAERLAAVLAGDRDCPGVGLEASIVEADAAATPAAPWPFVVHVTTALHDRKTVLGTPSVGDVDLILHYAVTRAFGWAAIGPSPETIIGAISERVVFRQLADELRWGIDHASESYAILNACRALRYRDERVLCSKTDGGEWALAHDVEPALVRRALDERRRGTSSPVAANAAAWVTSVAVYLDTP